MAQSIITHFLCLRLRLPLQASPPEEFDTSHTSKLWAVEQLLRYCAAHNEKLVLVGERYGCGWRWQCGRGFARESGASQAPAATSFFFWDSCKTLFGLLPCSLDYLGEIEQRLERLQLCMAGAPPSACATATFFPRRHFSCRNISCLSWSCLPMCMLACGPLLQTAAN